MRSGPSRIALHCDAEEERAIEVKREVVAGQEHVLWNPSLSLPAKEFDFADPEIARFKAAIQTWESYSVGSDRRWLRPLLDLLFPSDTSGSVTIADGVE